MSTYTPIYSPTNRDLALTLFVGNEGIMTKGVRVFEGVCTAGELVEHFTIEGSSDVIPSHLKRQRDLEKNRAKGLKTYFDERTDTILPGLTAVVSHLENEQEVQVGTKQLITAVLPAEADRLMCDGQNRLTLYINALQERPELADQTVNLKFVVSDTNTLEPVTEVIRQIFTDYHVKLKKPTPSQNLFFDSAEPYSLLLRRFLSLPIADKTLLDFVSVSGKMKPNHFMQYKQLENFLHVTMSSTNAKTNATLKKQPEQADAYFDVVSPYLTVFFNLFPLDQLEYIDRESAMFTKAIFWQGVAWVIRSVMEDAITNNTIVDWSLLNKLTDLPLGDMTDSFWLKAKVVIESEGTNGTKKFNMLKGSEKAMGRALCQYLRVFYSSDLA